MSKHDNTLLGKKIDSPDQYSPDILTPIARDLGRGMLGPSVADRFTGQDYWHCWELSWLSSEGLPQVRVGRLHIPASSPNLVESKSLKLYFNSLNSLSLTDDAQAIALIERDVSAVVEEAVQLRLFSVDAPQLAPAPVPGICLDDKPVEPVPSAPDAGLLQLSSHTVSHSIQRFHSHLLRSLCPVTAQPDWATVLICYQGCEILPASLLTYLLAYRHHQGFHEQCVEQIFTDIDRHCKPQQLLVQAFYTRRGGLDINPARWRGEDMKPQIIRLARQ